MKSEHLHNALSLPLLLLSCLSCLSLPSLGVWSHPMNSEQRPVIVIRNHVGLNDLKDYQIVQDVNAQGGPCLTISWTTSPDGTGPEDPQIYMGQGFFRLEQTQREPPPTQQLPQPLRVHQAAPTPAARLAAALEQQ